jgi:hypothetical protein
MKRARIVPSPAELLGGLVRFIGEVLGASSLRFEIGATLALLGVLLAVLQLIARPTSRWTSTDAGGLAAVGRAMALAAEAGTDVVVSLGGGGVARATDAFARLQTLAALPVLGHVTRAAARSGVPLRVLTNDAMAAVLAEAAVEASHASTATRERTERSRVVVAGEGRAVAAGLAMTARARPAAAVAVGSLREEAALQLEGLRDTSGSLVAGTAEASQAPTVVIAGGGFLLGAELFTAAAELRADPMDRTAVRAANRLVVAAIVVVLVVTVVGLAAGVDLRAVLSTTRAS